MRILLFVVLWIVFSLSVPDDSPDVVLLPRVSSCVDRSSFGFVGGALLSAWITGFFRGG